MKLATYKDASRDGQLVVVSRDLSTAHYATGIASYVERLSKVPGSAMPPNLYAEPLLRQGASDCFIGPCDDVSLASEVFGIDFKAQLAVITGDVPLGASPEQALDGIRLLVSHLCRTRPVSAGSIIGVGPVSHPDWGQGYSCIAEKRAVRPLTPFCPGFSPPALRQSPVRWGFPRQCRFSGSYRTGCQRRRWSS